MAIGESNSPISEYLTSKTIPIVVGTGDSQKTYQIHVDLLKAKSPYFNQLLDLPIMISDDEGEPADGQEIKPAELFPAPQEIKLPDVSIEAFHEVQEWLYKQQFIIQSHMLCISTYLLAYKFQMEQLRNDIVDAVRRDFAENNGIQISITGIRRLINRGERDPRVLNCKLLEFFIHQLAFDMTRRNRSPYDLQKVATQLGRRAALLEWFLGTIEELRNASRAGGVFGTDEESLAADGLEHRGGPLGKKRRKVDGRRPYGNINPCKRPACIYHEHDEGSSCEAVDRA